MFALLERLPALFDRNEVPLRAGRADHPEPTARRVERDPPAHREVGQLVIRA